MALSHPAECTALKLIAEPLTAQVRIDEDYLEETEATIAATRTDFKDRNRKINHTSNSARSRSAPILD